ncbi:MAG: multicopper oxidase domain-containing protein, partial [Leptolyngbyaceae cyanobacterium bins.59]|nr:multicopper oxidase domain-containing protein [Leptolyngbyaceae cyanobacterium bins.59]
MVPPSEKSGFWQRRQLLKVGLTGLGLSGMTIAAQRGLAMPPRPPHPVSKRLPEKSLDPMKILRDFDYGTVRQEHGRTVREFEVTANRTTLQLNSAVSFISWNLNGRVPGPTFRVSSGDRVRVIFHNQDSQSHSLHFHGIHPSEMDGIKPIRYGKTTVYEFDADPYGVYPYHCHIAPVTRHISKGLYGLLIVDPPGGRAPADELILVMGGYDLNND